MNIMVVLDTNIIVSAFWSKNGNPKRILDLVLEKRVLLAYDHRILAEYTTVLNRPKFNFSPSDITDLLNEIKRNGIAITALPNNAEFTDESVRKFYEVAKSCNAILITGNLKHFPDEPFIMTATEFLEKLSEKD
jgi:putative PIN family toxin of toxin-antitoxin system